MLEAVVSALHSRLAHVVVVAAEGQRLPVIPGTATAVDAVPGQGPLRGLEAGLRAAHRDGYASAFVAATDMPMLTGETVSLLLERYGVGASAAGAVAPDAVVAVVGGRDQPLASVYRTRLWERIDGVLGSGTSSLRGFLAGLEDAGLRIERAALEGAAAEAVLNVNTPGEAARARARRRVR